MYHHRRYQYKPSIGSAQVSKYYEHNNKWRKRPKWNLINKYPIYRKYPSSSIRALQIANNCIKRMRPELKRVDTQDAINPQLALPESYALNAIGQNVGVNERKGSQVTMTDLTLRMTTIVNEEDTTGSYIWRVIVIIDKQPNGTIISLADLFENTNTILSPINRTIRERIIILIDEAFQLQAKFLRTKTLTWFRKLHKCKATYIDSGATYAAIETNSIIAYFWTDAPDANGPEAAFFARLRFTDD